MIVSTLRIRVLILAAYLLAAVLPGLAIGEGRQQSQVDHAQMMAMAGHMAQMPATDRAKSDAQMLLCQQHCMFAAAPFPSPNRVAEAVACATSLDVRFDVLARSLAIPPPGRPPKIAVI
ncbi:MAG: hypothetical protein ACT4OK_02125 [Gemmobacter sp.]